MGGSIDLDAAPPHFEAGADEPQGAASSPKGVLPPAATLDRLAYRIIAFGFPVWTFSVIAGAIWAQSAWGRYWGWDPKETWSFITWVIFAGYLHARATSGWKGRRAAVIAHDWAGPAPLVLGGDLNIAGRPELPGLRHVAGNHVDHILVSGFEPTGRLNDGQRFSRPPRSTAPAPRRSAIVAR